MPQLEPSGDPGAITAVIVTHESEAVLGSCLEALGRAASRRRLRPVVVDNASQDRSAALARDLLGEENVVRLETNRGFAAGVNAVLAGFAGEWLALVNPDVLLPPGSLDHLADRLVEHPRLGLVAPRVVGPDGRPESSAGHFPTLGREWTHAFLLDRLPGVKGRRRRVPDTFARVDWVSGSMWMLRGEAVRETGALDEGYFMYFEDVDYCRRLADRGWEVAVAPDVEVVHAGAGGSARSQQLPADGGTAPLVHYFRKHHPHVAPARVERALVWGWRVRHAMHRLRTALGHTPARALAERYRSALRSRGAGFDSPQPPH